MCPGDMIARRRLRGDENGERDQILPVQEQDRFVSRSRTSIRHRRRNVAPRKALHTWLAAVVVVVLYTSRYIRQNLDSAREGLSLAELVSEKLSGTREDSLSFEIFSSPKPFVGADKVNQIRAIESWLALVPRPRVTLLGEGELYDEVANDYGLHRMRNVDSNFLGVPLFNSMVDAANRSEKHIAVLINSDVMLFDDFPYVLRKTQRSFKGDWMALGARWDVEKLPELAGVRGAKNIRGPELQRVRMVNGIRENGTLHTYGGIDVWAWNTKGAPLFEGTMPPFVFGRGKYDNWFTHEVVAANRRAVIDISQACTVAHVRHDYHLVTALGSMGDSSRTSHSGVKRDFWNDDIRLKFEPYINSHLADRYGSYSTQQGTILHAKFVMRLCYESEGICLFQRKNPHRCRCEHSPYVGDAQSDPYIVSDSRVIFCGLMTADSILQERSVKERYPISGQIRIGEVTPFGLPLTIKQLLNLSTPMPTAKYAPVILTVLNAKYERPLMNLACNLRHIGLFRNLVIAALDEKTYRRSITQGLPVFLEDTIFDTVDEEAYAATTEHGAAGHEAMLSFRIRVMKRILQSGRDVLLVNPDVVLLRNPFSKLLEATSDIVLTSLVDHGVAPNAAKTKLSTGILFARANEQNIKWIDSIHEMEKNGIDHKRAIYEVSCGKTGQHRQGRVSCKGKGSTSSISFLDRSIFGSFSRTSTGQKGKLLGLNNEENNFEHKMEALRRNQFVFVDEQTKLCTYPQHIERHHLVDVPG